MTSQATVWHIIGVLVLIMIISHSKNKDTEKMEQLQAKNKQMYKIIKELNEQLKGLKGLQEMQQSQTKKVSYEMTLSKVQDWAVERGLHKADPAKQMLKLIEEVGELAAAMARDNQIEKLDSIGDIQVVLTVLCLQLGVDYWGCFENAYQVIKNRQGQMVNGVFVKNEDIESEGVN